VSRLGSISPAFTSSHKFWLRDPFTNLFVVTAAAAVLTLILALGSLDDGLFAAMARGPDGQRSSH
jgi:hypothetical protein